VPTRLLRGIVERTNRSLSGLPFSLPVVWPSVSSAGDGVPSLPALAMAPVAALAGGLTLGALYGRYHDWYVRRGYWRMVREMYGGVENFHCASTFPSSLFPFAFLHLRLSQLDEREKRLVHRRRHVHVGAAPHDEAVQCIDFGVSAAIEILRG
jgi:hypothetical protein